MVGTVVSTTLLAAIVTKLVDLVRKLDTNDSAPKYVWILVSMAFGIVIALIWQVDALAELGVAPSGRLQGVAGQILTGLLVGGFGSGWHEVFDALSRGAKSARANAAAQPNLSAGEKKAIWGATVP